MTAQQAKPIRKKLSKNSWKKLVSLFAIISAVFFTGCSTLKFTDPPPDSFACVETRRDESATCIYKVSGNEFDVNNTDKRYKDPKLGWQTWKQMKVGSLVVPATEYAKDSAWIQSQCKKAGTCGKDLGKWQRRDTEIRSIMRGGVLLMAEDNQQFSDLMGVLSPYEDGDAEQEMSELQP